MLIYRYVLLLVSPLYYKGTGQSPYPFVGRGFTPAAFFDSRRSLGREQAPALRCDSIITQIGRESKSDIVSSDSDMKAYGFRDILFAKNSRSEYHLGVAQISLLAISLAKGE